MLVSKSVSVQKLLDVAMSRRDEVATKKRRDKLRNAATLKVEIPKFSGYDCSIDFFYF